MLLFYILEWLHLNDDTVNSDLESLPESKLLFAK